MLTSACPFVKRVIPARPHPTHTVMGQPDEVGETCNHPPLPVSLAYPSQQGWKPRLWTQTGEGSTLPSLPAVAERLGAVHGAEASLKRAPELGLGNCWLTAWPSLNAQKTFANTLWAPACSAVLPPVLGVWRAHRTLSRGLCDLGPSFPFRTCCYPLKTAQAQLPGQGCQRGPGAFWAQVPTGHRTSPPAIFPCPLPLGFPAAP